MPPERRSLTADELADVLRRLDDLLVEAERLRREATRQLSQQRADQKQVPPAARKNRAKRKSR